MRDAEAVLEPLSMASLGFDSAIGLLVAARIIISVRSCMGEKIVR